MPRKFPRPSAALALAVALPLCGLAPLTGCTQMPDLDGAIGTEARLAPYPAILPLERLSLPAPGSTDAAIAEAARLAARAADLRRRARSMRQEIIDKASRKRMLAAVARHWGAAKSP